MKIESVVCPSAGGAFSLNKMIDHLIAEYNEESARITQERLLAWSSASVYQSICGIEIKPLTARAWVDLQLAKNEVILGDGYTDGAIAAYIWRVSKDFVCANHPNAESLSGKIIKQIEDFDEAFIEVLEHISAAFEEMPRSNGTSGGGFTRKNGFDDIEGIVGAIDEVSARYGQNPDEVIDWPLNRIFQLQKALRLATVPDYKLRQPEKIMAIRSEFLKQLNNGES